MKRTLLEIVQSILSDLDSEGVNSIEDTVEALQVASVVEDTFYNIVTTRDIPEHYRLIKLTSLSNSQKPTHFTYPSNVRRIDTLKYKTTEGYTDITFVDPLTFLSRTGAEVNNTVEVTDVHAGTSLYIRNDRTPSYYTSFDDQTIVMNSYDASIETILQASKTQAFGVIHPEFVKDDTHVPDMDDVMFPLLIAEAKSTCFSLFKGGVDPKIDQAARRHKSYIQNDMYKTKRDNKRPTYGRR